MCRDNGECAVIDYMILVLLYKTMFLFKFIKTVIIILLVISVFI